jgi:tripartite-type tricarboxylate transporter receptor subunit TctC
MRLPRRRFLRLATAVAMPALSRIAWAQTYPTRPVRLLVGYVPGGPSDITARLITQYLSDRLGQPSIVENRPGASGNIATEVAARSPPDGYTLLLIGSWNAINATLFKLDFNFIDDIAPVAGVIRDPNVMEVHPSLPVTTVPEFIIYAKATPGQISLAAPGSGTSQHLSGELFKMIVGVDMLAVQYRGSGAALADLLGGQVQVMFDAIPSSIGHIRSSRLRALAVTTVARSQALPDVPSLADFVPGYKASGWNGIGAPKRTSVINQIRGFLIERGITVRQGAVPLRKVLPEILGSNTDVLSPRIVSLVADLTQDWRHLAERIAAVSAEIEALAEQDDGCQRLMSVPGIGPITSSAMVAAIGNGAGFKQGRDFGAWLGLVPKQQSTGDRTILGNISKRGNTYLRTLFVQAAQVVLMRRPPRARAHLSTEGRGRCGVTRARSGPPKGWPPSPLRTIARQRSLG